MLSSLNSQLYENFLISFVGNYERYILSRTQCGVVGRLVRIFSAVRCGEISGPSKGLLDEYFGSWQRRLFYSRYTKCILSVSSSHCTCPGGALLLDIVHACMQ